MGSLDEVFMADGKMYFWMLVVALVLSSLYVDFFQGAIPRVALTALIDAMRSRRASRNGLVDCCSGLNSGLDDSM